MFLAMYETRRVYFAEGAVLVTRTPYPQEPYGAQLEDHAGEPVTAWGDTPLAAIAALNEELKNV